MEIKKIIIAVIIIILITAGLLLIHINPKIENYIELNQVVKYEDVKDKIKTGDVLIFMGTTIKSAIVRTYLQCPATHVGMIIKIKNNFYVLDIGWRFNKKSDVKLRPIEKIFNSKNSLNIYGLYPCKEELKLNETDIKEYLSFEFNWSPFSMFSLHLKETKYKVCSSFVAKIHEDNNMHNLSSDSHTITPKDYFNASETYFVKVD